MLATATVVALVCFVSFAVMVGIAIIVKIWKADPEQLKEYRRLKDLARRANDDQADAEHQCECNSDIKITTYWNSTWGNVKSYSVHRRMLYACFGHY